MEAESKTAGSAAPVTSLQASPRLEWIDAIKGIAILWVVLYHFFSTYSDGRDPSPLARHFFGPFMARCAPATIVDSAPSVVLIGAANAQSRNDKQDPKSKSRYL